MGESLPMAKYSCFINKTLCWCYDDGNICSETIEINFSEATNLDTMSKVYLIGHRNCGLERIVETDDPSFTDIHSLFEYYMRNIISSPFYVGAYNQMPVYFQYYVKDSNKKKGFFGRFA